MTSKAVQLNFRRPCGGNLVSPTAIPHSVCKYIFGVGTLRTN